MFTFTSKSRQGMAVVSAGAAAALLLTGLGVSNATADNLNWNPAGTPGTSSSGSGTWDTGTTSDWYDTNTSSQSTWAAGDSAVFGMATTGTGSYTATLGSSISATNVNTNPANAFAGTLTLIGNGTSTSSYSITASGTVHFGGDAGNGGTVPVGVVNLQNVIFNSTSGSPGDEVWGSTLNVGDTVGSASYGATYNATTYLDIGGANVAAVNVNKGGLLNVGSYIRIGGDNGAGSANGSVLNVNTGGAVNVTANGGYILLDNGHLTANSKGTLNMNGGTLSANFLYTPDSNSTLETGILNLNGGILSTQHISEQTGSTTIVNFNGGTLHALASIGLIGNPGSTYTVPANLNVMAGGAIIDTNGYQPAIYNPLLTGTPKGTPDGGLTVENSDPTRGGISIASNGALTITGGLLTITGANTYTGPTVINSDAVLQLEDHTASSPNGGVTGVATIADTSLLQINSGGALVLNPDGVGTQISVGGLTMNGGIISLGLDGSSFQNLLVGTAASISGTNIINLTVLASTAVPTGTYTLIADAAGGLSGTFEFGNGSTTGTLTVGSNTYMGTLHDSANALTLSVSAVPEPTAVALLAIGAMGLLLIRRRKPAA